MLPKHDCLTYMSVNYVFLIFSVMEVASGEYEVNLEQAAKIMTQFKPELTNGNCDAHVLTIPALPSAMGN
jgi:hypothetical protein